MKYIDFAIAISIFLIFFALVIIFSSNYFSNLGGLTKTSEFRPVTENIFKIFESKGIPENWIENTSVTPVKIGLAEDLYQIPILVTETNGTARINEPVTVRIVFDELCQNKTWNRTFRLYDEYDNQLDITLSNVTTCTNLYWNQSNVTFDVNISANENKRYFLYYSSDDNIPNPNYPSSLYNTSSWKPSDKDEWTDKNTANFSHWSRLGGSSSPLTNDTVNKMRGNSSVNITDTFSYGNILGLVYAPSNNISGLSFDWYLDVWLYLDNKTNISQFAIEVTDANNDICKANIINNVQNGVWYNFVKQMLPSSVHWGVLGGCNASTGIKNIQFYLVNQTVDLTRTLKVDGLHFKLKSLDVKVFPERKINALSSNKFNSSKDLNYDYLKKTIGENYDFKIEIDGDSYGGNINMSSNTACYDSPKIIQFNNGTISRVTTKVCVWK